MLRIQALHDIPNPHKVTLAEGSAGNIARRYNV
jgi:hypothetical protein